MALDKPLPENMEAQLPTIYSTLESGLRPTGKEALAIELGRLGLHCRPPDHSQSQLKILMEDYIEDLSEFPLDLIQDACKEWRRNEKWWPKISELREIITKLHSERKNALFRANSIINSLELAKGNNPFSKKFVKMEKF
jgi:hypothetical protein